MENRRKIPLFNRLGFCIGTSKLPNLKRPSKLSSIELLSKLIRLRYIGSVKKLRPYNIALSVDFAAGSGWLTVVANSLCTWTPTTH